MNKPFTVRDAHQYFSKMYKDIGGVGGNLILIHKNNKVGIFDINPDILREGKSLKGMADALSANQYQKIILVVECWGHTEKGKSTVVMFRVFQETGITTYLCEPIGRNLGKLEITQSSPGFADPYFMGLVA